jgi:hypothetical protein
MPKFSLRTLRSLSDAVTGVQGSSRFSGSDSLVSSLLLAPKRINAHLFISLATSTSSALIQRVGKHPEEELWCWQQKRADSYPTVAEHFGAARAVIVPITALQVLVVP